MFIIAIIIRRSLSLRLGLGDVLLLSDRSELTPDTIRRLSDQLKYEQKLYGE